MCTGRGKPQKVGRWERQATAVQSIAPPSAQLHSKKEMSRPQSSPTIFICFSWFLLPHNSSFHTVTSPAHLYQDLSAPTISVHLNLKFLIWIFEREYLTCFLIILHQTMSSLLTTLWTADPGKEVHFWCKQLNCGWWETEVPWLLHGFLFGRKWERFHLEWSLVWRVLWLTSLAQVLNFWRIKSET